MHIFISVIFVEMTSCDVSKNERLV